MKVEIGGSLIFTAVTVGAYLNLGESEQERAILFLLFALALVWFGQIRKLTLGAVRMVRIMIANFRKR